MKAHFLRPRAFISRSPVLLAAGLALFTCHAPMSTRAQAAEEVAAAEEAAAQPPKVGETAPDFELEDMQGEKVKLSTVAEAGPVVLVMLRGFPGYQCPICTAQVGELMSKAEAFKKAGAQVLMVYPGSPEGLREHARDFVHGKDLPDHFILALDPDFAFTKQYGLRWDAKGETSYPSTFVLDTARRVLYAKVSRSHGDRAPIEDVLAALPKPN